jgi:enamine deaminase RidA (YjgF/YER057c/UK114 family)
MLTDDMNSSISSKKAQWFFPVGEPTSGFLFDVIDSKAESATGSTVAVSTGQEILAGSAHEVLTLGGAVCRKSGIVCYYENDTFLVGHVHVAVNLANIEAQTLLVYDAILDIVGPRSFCRIWNYIPNINQEGETHIEAYKLFCSGRSLAFTNAYGGVSSDRFSAASATGCTGEFMTVVFMSTHLSVDHEENPQQTPAYKYPEQYGPRAPSFARISRIVGKDGDEWVFVSGTAAIKSSESQFVGDLSSQVEMTFENIDLTLTSIGLRLMDAYPKRRRHFRVYLRRRADLNRLLIGLQKVLEPSDTYSVVEADICRTELDVEIELTIFPASLAFPV